MEILRSYKWLSRIKLNIQMFMGGLVFSETFIKKLKHQVARFSIFRYLVASRDLKKGDILIEVDALVIGPCAESSPLCLGCYVDLIPLPKKNR